MNVVRIDGQVEAVATGVVVDGKLARLYVVRNPDKLATVQDERVIRRV